MEIIVAVDDNECDRDKYTTEFCDENAKCVNTKGGFKCECKPGYKCAMPRLPRRQS